MFGANPIRPIIRDLYSIAVEEAFYTIQGEGPLGGSPALFIRLAGCNLACHFCDTQFETQVENVQAIESVVQDLVAQFTQKQRRLVVLTGGEPLRQQPLMLIKRLLASGTELVQIETAGTVWQDGLEDLIALDKVILVCSPKTPKVHPLVAISCHHWKYIIRGNEVDPEDGLPNRGTQVANQGKVQRLFRPSVMTHGPQNIWLSPCDDYDAELNKVNQDLARDLCLKHGYRLSLQMHKIIGVA